MNAKNFETSEVIDSEKGNAIALDTISQILPLIPADEAEIVQEGRDKLTELLGYLYRILILVNTDTSSQVISLAKLIVKKKSIREIAPLLSAEIAVYLETISDEKVGTFIPELIDTYSTEELEAFRRALSRQYERAVKTASTDFIAHIENTTHPNLHKIAQITRKLELEEAKKNFDLAVGFLVLRIKEAKARGIANALSYVRTQVIIMREDISEEQKASILEMINPLEPSPIYDPMKRLLLNALEGDYNTPLPESIVDNTEEI